MIEMVVLDLDGTLLDDDMDISLANIDLIEKLRCRNIPVTIATGRSIIGLPKSLEKIGKIDYIISSNGTSILDVKAQNIIYSNWLETASTIRIMNRLENYPIIMDCLIEGAWHMQMCDKEKLLDTISTPQIVKYIINSRKFHQQLSSYIIDEKKRVEKITINFNPDCKERKDIIAALNEIVHEDRKLRIWSDKPHKLDVYKKNATKGTALLKLCSMKQIVPANVWGFGDDENDMELFQAIGNSVAMGNACSKLKEIARMETDTNNQAGIVKALVPYLDESK